MDPTSGEVASLESLKHLDDERLETAQILREVMDHYLASEAKKDKTAQIAVLERIAREQAFTILNRLAALRMMEARGSCLNPSARPLSHRPSSSISASRTGLWATPERPTSISCSVCSTSSQRTCLLCLIALARRAVSSRGRPTLLPHSRLINSREIEPLWAEDETIGWIYQYFNARKSAKRCAMRPGTAQQPRAGGPQSVFHPALCSGVPG